MAYVTPGYWAAGYAVGDIGTANVTVTATTANLVGAMGFAPASKFSVNATTGNLAGAMGFTPAARLAIAATLQSMLGTMSFSRADLSVVSVHATTDGISATMSFGSGGALAVNANTAGLAGSMSFSGSVGGGVSGPLSDADIARIVAAVLAALNATTIPVDMKKTNGVQIVGDGTPADKFRSALYVG